MSEVWVSLTPSGSWPPVSWFSLLWNGSGDAAYLMEIWGVCDTVRHRQHRRGKPALLAPLASNLRETNLSKEKTNGYNPRTRRTECQNTPRGQEEGPGQSPHVASEALLNSCLGVPETSFRPSNGLMWGKCKELNTWNLYKLEKGQGLSYYLTQTLFNNILHGLIKHKIIPL